MKIFSKYMRGTPTTKKQTFRYAVTEVYKKFMSAAKSGDVDALTGLYTDDAQIFPPDNDAVSGKDAIRELAKAVRGMGIHEIEVKPERFEEHGTIAIVTCKNVMKGSDGSVLDTGKFVDVLKNEDGQWKLNKDIWNGNKPGE